jgi:hypothetical protein
MKIGITQKTPLGDQADSLIPMTAIIDITEEKIRNVIAERAVDQKIPSRDSKLLRIQQYGCGSVRFTGTDEALYERHLVFCFHA